jgi:redox-sensitive bicupin YhaK (pirin superfamily)
MTIFASGTQMRPSAQPVVLNSISGRKAEGSDFNLRQTLPCRDRRMIGAWCFLEHTGPNDVQAGSRMRISPHPHAGVQAFTWMVEGELLHRDSLGNKQVIRSGEVNLLTAGRGVSHCEESLADASPRVHAVQLWIALPEAMRACEPSFVHYATLPALALAGFSLTLLVGRLFGEESPVPVNSPLIGFELVTNGAADTIIPLRGDFEYGVMVLVGEAVVAGKRLFPGELLYVGEHHTRLKVHCDGAASLLLVGGKPLTERPLLWWNFVGRNREELTEYARLWNVSAHFGVVPDCDGMRVLAPVVPTGIARGVQQ